VFLQAAGAVNLRIVFDCHNAPAGEAQKRSRAGEADGRRLTARATRFELLAFKPGVQIDVAHATSNRLPGFAARQ
jgi:predicted neutral ceramidase superfamily lipid hydrolase